MAQSDQTSRIGTTERSINMVMITSVAVIMIGFVYPLHLYRVLMPVEAAAFTLFIPIGITALIMNHRRGWNKLTVVDEVYSEDGKTVHLTLQYPNGHIVTRTERIKPSEEQGDGAP